MLSHRSHVNSNTTFNYTRDLIHFFAESEDERLRYIDSKSGALLKMPVDIITQALLQEEINKCLMEEIITACYHYTETPAANSESFSSLLFKQRNKYYEPINHYLAQRFLQAACCYKIDPSIENKAKKSDNQKLLHEIIKYVGKELNHYLLNKDEENLNRFKDFFINAFLMTVDEVHDEQVFDYYSCGLQMIGEAVIEQLKKIYNQKPEVKPTELQIEMMIHHAQQTHKYHKSDMMSGLMGFLKGFNPQAIVKHQDALKKLIDEYVAVYPEYQKPIQEEKYERLNKAIDEINRKQPK